MTEIVALKLGRLKERLQQTHRVQLEVDDAVAQQILQRCAEVETGARNIDHILSRTLLPMISRALLDQMAGGAALHRMHLVLEGAELTLKLDDDVVG